MTDESPNGWTDREPALYKQSFHCPHCSAFAAMGWYDTRLVKTQSSGLSFLPGWRFSECAACHEYSAWLNQALVYPDIRIGPAPDGDMPEDVRVLYEEARSISAKSPRAAAGLLRLALQTLVDSLVEGSGSINEKIGGLVQKGLSPVVQQAMDTLRIAGNNAVHPGTIQLHDEPQQLSSLFGLVNVIVEQMIRQPRIIQELYGQLPPTSLEAISRRDKATSSE